MAGYVVAQVNAITLDPKIRKGSCRKKKKTAMLAVATFLLQLCTL